MSNEYNVVEEVIIIYYYYSNIALHRSGELM